MLAVRLKYFTVESCRNTTIGLLGSDRITHCIHNQRISAHIFTVNIVAFTIAGKNIGLIFNCAGYD